MDQNSKITLPNNSRGVSHKANSEFMNQILQSCMPKPQSSHGNRMQKYYCRNIDRQKNEIRQGLGRTNQSQKPDRSQMPQLVSSGMSNLLLHAQNSGQGNQQIQSNSLKPEERKSCQNEPRSNLLKKARFGSKNIEAAGDAAPYLFKKKI